MDHEQVKPTLAANVLSQEMDALLSTMSLDNILEILEYLTTSRLLINNSRYNDTKDTEIRRHHARSLCSYYEV